MSLLDLRRTGAALCCFEPHVVPEFPDKRFVVIRVLKILDADPVRLNPSYSGPEYRKEQLPKEGDLLMSLYRSKLQPWIGNVDHVRRKPNGHTLVRRLTAMTADAFKMLFENEERYGRYQVEG